MSGKDTDADEDTSTDTKICTVMHFGGLHTGLNRPSPPRPPGSARATIFCGQLVKEKATSRSRGGKLAADGEYTR
jgi:hypothetical protein